jgi:hypothetical protein
VTFSQASRAFLFSVGHFFTVADSTHCSVAQHQGVVALAHSCILLRYLLGVHLTRSLHKKCHVICSEIDHFLANPVRRYIIRIEVATGGDTGEDLPMLIRLPRFNDELHGYAMLGLGDVVSLS